MANLDRTLDDMIQMNRTSRTGSRNSGPAPTRRIPNNRSAARAAPYFSAAARAPAAQWGHGMFPAASAAAGTYPIRGGAMDPAGETGTRLLISNLHYGVSDDDIRELFAGVGDLKTCSVNYDRSGRSEGTADVVFYRRRDAENAIKRYNNVQLDGMPMKIEIIGVNLAAPPLLATPSYGRNFGAQGRGNATRRPPGGGRGMRRDRGGAGKGRGGEKISAEDLDADLDKYLAQAKETN